MDGPAPAAHRRARTPVARVFKSRWTRVPLWFVGGILVAVGIAWWLEPRWVELCSKVDTRARGCPAIDLTTMAGYVLIGAGFVVMMLGPIANSLYHLFRYGQKWETTRHETAVSNIPIVAGLVYMAAGFVTAALA